MEYWSVAEEAILHWSGIIWKGCGLQCGKQDCYKHLREVAGHTSPIVILGSYIVRSMPLMLGGLGVCPPGKF